jgi:nitroimidazol reductase NimA-like FMN-containing flavoprotein (pyridoxamine 5'-phosphate oxidase superfamily)
MKDEEAVKKWVLKHKHCVLGTSNKGKPWAATVDYRCDEKMRFFVATRPDSLKYKNISVNPNVCLVIDEQNDNGTLQISGKAKISDNPKTGENIIIEPKIMVFKKMDEKSKKMKEIKLSL